MTDEAVFPGDSNLIDDWESFVEAVLGRLSAASGSSRKSGWLIRHRNSALVTPDRSRTRIGLSRNSLFWDKISISFVVIERLSNSSGLRSFLGAGI